MVFPLRIDNLKHQHAFGVAHSIGADGRFFLVVLFMSLREEALFELLGTEFVRLDAFSAEIKTELLENSGLKTFQVPLVGMYVLGCAARNEFDHDVVRD